MVENDFLLSEKQIFVARQPVFDKNKEVYAYKLLFRSGFENFFSFEIDGDIATSKFLSNTMHLLGVDKLASGKPVFITLTENLLKSKVFTIFPKDHIIIDIPQSLNLSEDLIDECLELKKKNYVFCTDKRLLSDLPHNIGNIIKIDFKKYFYEETKNLLKEHQGEELKFLAVKVETYEEFEKAKEIGFDYFQGYFFSKPQVVSAKDISPFKLNQIHMLQEVYKAEIDFKAIEKIVKSDVSLSYKLLRFLNSSSFALKSEIRSILHALTILGIEELKKWITLISMTGLGNDKPEELVVSSITRGFFMREYAKLTKQHNKIEDYFLYGVFSLIDSLLDRKMEDIVAELPLSKEVKEALTGETNKFSQVGKVYLSFEKGEWSEFIGMCKSMSVNEGDLASIYAVSVEQAFNLFKVCK